MQPAADVLVVDDEVEIIQLLNEVLTDEGYRVRSVRDGLSALSAVASAPPALVLLDYSIPGLSGGDVVARLRASGYAELPIVIMSASSLVNQARVPGATAFLDKPFDLDALLDCVGHYVRNNLPE